MSLTTIAANQELVSTNSKDRGRRVRVTRLLGNYVELENLETGRKSRALRATVQKNYRPAATTQRATPTASTKTAKTIRHPRQQALLRIIKRKFSDFQKRQQHYYLGGGMSTTHVVTAVISDIEDLKLFWPKELIKTSFLGGQSYVLADDAMRRVQSTINRTLNDLADAGHLEKVGNNDERRWKPTYAKEA